MASKIPRSLNKNYFLRTGRVFVDFERRAATSDPVPRCPKLNGNFPRSNHEASDDEIRQNWAAMFRHLPGKEGTAREPQLLAKSSFFCTINAKFGFLFGTLLARIKLGPNITEISATGLPLLN